MRTAPISLIASWLVCLSLSGTAQAQYFNHSYAIVIGIDSYESSRTFPTLHYAVKDAMAMADLLRAQGFAVTPLYGANAKKAAIISAMEDNIAPKLGADDRVLVFFAGHGKTETLGGQKRGYIVPYDGNGGSSLISMEELKNQSSYMGSARHQLFIMDSCYGGLLAEMRDSVVDTHVPHYLKDVTDRVARQVLTAGGEGQTVLDGGPKGHSVFMDALLEALQDGLADLNGDGYITFHELVAYVTPRASNDFETPGDGVLPGHQEGEFLFKNPKGLGQPVIEIPVPAALARRSGADPLTATQHMATGNARWNVGDWAGAAAEYKEAIQIDRDNALAHRYLGAALTNQKDWDEAIREAHEAIRLSPNDPYAHAELGLALGNKGDLDGEILEEREAIRLKPDFAGFHSNLGISLYNKGDLDGDIREQSEAIRLNPDLAEAHNALGFALGCKRDWEGDIREQAKAIRLRPDFAEAHESAGIALTSIGDWDGAIQEERDAIRLRPDFPEAHNALGFALEHKGDTRSALAEYRRALELKPGFTDAQTRYNQLLKR